MTDKQQFIAELPRTATPMDFRNSSAVVDKRINALNTTVTIRREQAIGSDWQLRRFSSRSGAPLP